MKALSLLGDSLKESPDAVLAAWRHRLINRNAILRFAALLLLLAVGNWVFASATFEETKITASSPLDRTAFGVGTAIGPRIAVIGSLGASQPYGPGAVHVFLDVSEAGDWSDLVERTWSASDGATQDYFGFNIALEERTIVVSAHGLNAVYLYQDESLSGDWSSISETKIVPSSVGGTFGWSIDIDGSVLAVGAAGAAVHLFRDTSASGDWSTYEETKVLPSGGGATVGFGSSVDLQGRSLLVGARAKAYLMRDTSADNSWSSISEAILGPSTIGYSHSVALVGSVAAVGDSTTRTVHLFLDTSGEGSWASHDEVEIKPFDWATFAEGFGFTMSLSENFLVVGAYHDEQVARYAGAVYVYQDTSPDLDWSSYSETKILASDAAESDCFGRGLAASAEAWIAGAVNNDAAGENAGAAYIFSYQGVVDLSIESIDADNCPSISLIASVVDEDGQAILGLDESDFLLKQDGSPESVTLSPVGNDYQLTWESPIADGSTHDIELTVWPDTTGDTVVSSYSQSATACDTSACLSARSLPLEYLSGIPLPVAIYVNPTGSEGYYSVLETVPIDWVITDINYGGVYHGLTSQVEWVFFDTDPRTLSYSVEPPLTSFDTKSFSGQATFNGIDQPVCGNDQISKSGHHQADSNLDWSLTTSEYSAFATAWRTGSVWPVDPNPISVSNVSNSAYLWLVGGDYFYDPAESPPQVAGNPASPELPVQIGAAVSTLSQTEYVPGQPVIVTIEVGVDSGAHAYATEDSPPSDWLVSDISDGGIFDSVNGKVKWGPYSDTVARNLQYEVTPPLDESGGVSFVGLLAIDGGSQLIGGDRTLSVDNDWAIFSDGFESGDTTMWSRTVP